MRKECLPARLLTISNLIKLSKTREAMRSDEKEQDLHKNPIKSIFLLLLRTYFYGTAEYIYA